VVQNQSLMCVCVCIYIYTHIHTHTHTPLSPTLTPFFNLPPLQLCSHKKLSKVENILGGIVSPPLHSQVMPMIASTALHSLPQYLMPHCFSLNCVVHFTSNKTSKEKDIFPCHNHYHFNKYHANMSPRLAEVNYKNKQKKRTSVHDK
jgi:hypothetical protein